MSTSSKRLDMRLRRGWRAQRSEDARRLTTFLRIVAGLEDPGAAHSLR